MRPRLPLIVYAAAAVCVAYFLYAACQAAWAIGELFWWVVFGS